MGNVCSIFHSRYDKIFAHFRSHNKAVVLDKMLFWWQHSKYTFKNNPAIWFSRDYETMANATGVALSTLKTYLADFDKEGFIQRQSKLVSLKQEDGSIQIKKRCFIRFTDKFLALLNIDTSERPQEENAALSPEQPKDWDTSSFFAQDCTIEKPDSGLSYIKVNKGFGISNSTISNAVAVDKPKIQDRFSSFAIESEIGERLSQRDKNYIKGVLRNLETAKPGLISNPEQVFAEIVFSILNDEQWTGKTENLRHRINIIAKLIRNRSWRTPKGFYNHCDFSQRFIPKGYRNRKPVELYAGQDNETPATPAQEQFELEQEMRRVEEKIKSCEMAMNSQHIDIERYGNAFSLAARACIVADIAKLRQEEVLFQNQLIELRTKTTLSHRPMDSRLNQAMNRAGYLKLSLKRMAFELEIITDALSVKDVPFTQEQLLALQEEIEFAYERYCNELVLLEEEIGVFASAA